MAMLNSKLAKVKITPTRPEKGMNKFLTVPKAKQRHLEKIKKTNKNSNDQHSTDQKSDKTIPLLGSTGFIDQQVLNLNVVL